MIRPPARVLRRAISAAALSIVAFSSAFSQAMVNETRDPNQKQDEEFAKLYKTWTGESKYGSPLVDHLPRVAGIPTPKEVLGYYIGAPAKLTYYADILKYYRALAKASPRVKIETIGKSDEGRELVVVWISSDENIRNLAQNRANLAKIADPRGMSEAQVRAIMAKTKPHYHFMGGLHSGETGPSEMLMELAYRLVTETSPMITQIRNNVYVSITPAAEPDGRDRNVDWFYRGLETAKADSIARGGKPVPADSAAGAPVAAARRRGRALLGQVRLPRQQPRHQPLAGLDARDHRLVLHRASADHARPARGASRSCTSTAAAPRRTPTSIRSSSPSFRSSRTGNSRR